MANSRLKMTLTRHQIVVIERNARWQAANAVDERDRVTWSGIAREAQKSIDWDDKRSQVASPDEKPR